MDYFVCFYSDGTITLETGIEFSVKSDDIFKLKSDEVFHIIQEAKINDIKICVFRGEIVCDLS